MPGGFKPQPSPSLPPSALPAPGGTHSVFIDLCDPRVNVYPSPPTPQGQGLCFAQGYILSPSIQPDTSQTYHNVSRINDLAQV